MEIKKRQYAESQKRQSIIHDLLHEKADVKETGIDYSLGEIYFCIGYKEYTLAYFEDYKELKACQDHLITLLKSIDQIIEDKHDLLYKVHG